MASVTLQDDDGNMVIKQVDVDTGTWAGKSWWLNHVTMSALRAGCVTLHINLEMREEELYQRFWRGRPKSYP